MLSLSLAFILSQDQTLRCYNCFLFNLFRPGRLLTYSVQAVSFIDGVQFTFFCLYFLFSCLCKSYSKNSSFFRKRGAKVMLFCLYLQIFSEVFSFFLECLRVSLGLPNLTGRIRNFLSLPLQPPSLSIAGAKVDTFSLPSKCFCIFF